MEQADELRLLRALLRASDYGVLLSDASRRDLICNRRFSDWFGLSEDETLQRSPAEVRAQVLPRLKDPEAFALSLEEIYADPLLRREDEIELILPRARVLRRFTAPVTNDQGQVIGRLWTFTDITRTRRLESKVQTQQVQLKEQARQLSAALRAAQGRLGKTENALTQTQQQLFESEKLSAVGLLAASVAHDIRNILTPIRIELALADQDLAQERQVSLQAIQMQIDQLALLTQRLLALARPAPDHRAPVDLVSLIGRVAALLQPHALLENVTITVRIARRLPQLSADAVQMEQILVNLSLNAIQAMRAVGGGALSFQAKRRCEGLDLIISDNGPGMETALRRRLFDPFFTTRPDGAGLGLFSCRRIVEAHGGRIAIKSKPSQGTQVRIWLPLKGAQ